MKPMFEEEIQFFNKMLNIQLPQGCWRERSKIYLNLDKETLMVEFNVSYGKVDIISNNIEKVVGMFRNKPWDEEIQENESRLVKLEKESVRKTIEFIESKKLERGLRSVFGDHDKRYDIPYRIGSSGGKDSTVTVEICKQAFEILGIENYIIDYFNPSNDTADTYRHIKEAYPPGKLLITNPEVGFYVFLRKVKNYFVPSIHKRLCCDNYKEGSIKSVLDVETDYILFSGVRKTEGSKRAYLDYDINESYLKKERKKKLIMNKQGIEYTEKKLNLPANWYRFAPIVKWEESDVWMYILWKGLKFNPMYRKGYQRVGCLICPYQSDVTDLMNKEYYPKQVDRWNDILLKNYELKHVGRRLKWTEEEWLSGRWKTAMSKESEIVSKYTPERVKELAQLKGISEELAQKYFKKKCTSCNNSVNPTDTAMSLKFFGRNTKDVYCKKCFKEHMNITDEEYEDFLYGFYSQDCALF